METSRKLPSDLFAAYDWVAAAGEIETLAKMNETAARKYVRTAARNATQHNVNDVKAWDIFGLWMWMRSL